MASDALENDTKQLLRAVKLLRDEAATTKVADYLKLAHDTTQQHLSRLQERGLIVWAGSVWKITEATARQAEIKQGIKEADRELICERLKNHPIDVVGRLTWIEDMYAMIEFARSHNSQLKPF